MSCSVIGFELPGFNALTLDRLLFERISSCGLPFEDGFLDFALVNF